MIEYLVNKWHLWLAKTQVSRVKWLDRNAGKLHFIVSIGLFGFAVFITYKLARYL